MTGPTVSIIIPCYNGEQYVGEAIDSALAQTYPHIELIVIDDGSTDNSVAVLQQFGHRIRWETGPNRGACAARNRGLRMARGECIQFLDADDLLSAQKLEQQIPFLLRDDADIITCDVEVVEMGHSNVIERYTQQHAEAFARCCFDDITTPGPLHRKARLEAIGGFNESLSCSQERDLHLRLAANGVRLAHCPQTLVTARRRTGSLSSNYPRVLRTRRDIIANCVDLLTQRGELTDERRACLAGMLARDGRASLRLGDVSAAREAFRAAAELHSSAGLTYAYGESSRVIARLLGPVWAEPVIQWKRRLFHRARSEQALS